MYFSYRQAMAGSPGSSGSSSESGITNVLSDLQTQVQELGSAYNAGVSELPVAQVRRTSTSTTSSGGAAVPGYRPLECMQRPGDLLYLPASWSHLTLNIGEAIGIGGQTALPADKRYTASCDNRPIHRYPNMTTQNSFILLTHNMDNY